jgi:hypothetical protein
MAAGSWQRPAQLQTVQRALAGDRCTVLALGLQLAGQHRHHRVEAQYVVVVQVLIAQRHPEHPLAHQRTHRVLDKQRVAPVNKAVGKPVDQADRPIRCSQQQRTRVRRDRSAVKTGDHATSFYGCKAK